METQSGWMIWNASYYSSAGLSRDEVEGEGKGAPALEAAVREEEGTGREGKERATNTIRDGH